VLRSRWVPRLLLGAGAIALSAAIVSISVGTGGPQVIKLRGGDGVQQLLGGIEQDGAYLGPPDAPVTISVFSDLQCSTCDDYQLDTVEPLIEEYARTGKARFEFRNYSLGQAETTQAAFAAVAAAEQDREWQFVETFFRNQDAAPGGNVSEQFLNDLGNSISEFDLDTWRRDMEAPETRARVEADAQLATDYGLRVNGPSMVVEGVGGTKVLQDSPSRREVEAAVEAVSGS
jgi:protein-disulfide isomerase